MSDRGAVRRVGLLVLAVNLGLALAKGAVWWTTGSLAVGSEALNSTADAAYSVVVVAGLYLTTRPPDFEHPHGHERIEPFVSLFVAVGMFAAGGGIIWQATRSVLAGDPAVSAGVPGIAVLAGAAVVKFWLYRHCLAVGQRHDSPAVVATAVDNRNDVLTAAAALAGVVGASLGVSVLDPLAAGVVAVGILYSGVGVVRENVDYLVGAAPPEDLRAEIVRRALSHPDVEGVHDVVAHYVGPEVDVSLHVEVEGQHSLLAAHDIETAVIEAIEEIPAVDEAFVHVDPKEAGEWERDAGP
ncbi:MAG: cation diffusion facilitator family transporter [Halobacteriales archaeon]